MKEKYKSAIKGSLATAFVLGVVGLFGWGSKEFIQWEFRQEQTKSRENAHNREFHLGWTYSDSEKMVQSESTTELLFGEQLWERVWREDLSSEQVYTFDYALYTPFRRQFHDEVHGKAEEVPRDFYEDARAVIYQKDIHPEKYDENGTLVLPKEIDGITFLSEDESKTRAGKLERIATAKVPVGSLVFYDSRFSQETFDKAVSKWLKYSTIVAVDKAMELAKARKAKAVNLTLEHTVPGGIRTYGNISGRSFLGGGSIKGSIDTQSNYFLNANIELYK
jgi:hypothetical protein